MPQQPKPANQGWSFASKQEEAKAAAGWELQPEPLAPAGQRLTQRYLRGINPIPILSLVARLGPVGTPQSRREAWGQLLSPHAYTARRSAEEAEKGNISGATAYGAATLLPMLGPQIAMMGEDIRGGDVAGPIGDVLAYLTTAGLGRAIPRVLKASGRDFYKSGVGLGTKIPRDVKEAAITEGLQEGWGMTGKSLEKVKTKIGEGTARVETITSDPAHAQAPIPISSVLSGLDRYLAREYRRNKTSWRRLKKQREEWAKELETGPTPSGAPPPGGGMTTVEKAQQIKQDISAELKDTSYAPSVTPDKRTIASKKIQRGLKTEIEKSIPSEDIAGINAAVRREVYLKNAIERAINRDPGWPKDWAVFALGGSLIGGGVTHMLGGNIPLGASIGAASGAIARMSMRNPRIMARTGIMLHRAGEYLPPEMFRYPAISVPMARAQEDNQ